MPDAIDTRTVRTITVTAPGVAVVPQVDAYLTPTVGYVTTPDPGVPPADFCVVTKLRVTNLASSAAQYIATQRNGGQIAYAFRVQSNAMYFLVSTNGTGFTQPNGFGVLSGSAGSGLDLWFAATFDADNGAAQHEARGLYSLNGTTWSPMSTPRPMAPALTAIFDSTQPVTIGGRPVNVERLDGRIYSVEQRTGLNPAAGTVQWRFDANEYPGTGTSYVDPRGRTWTLAAAGAITPKVPATITTRPVATLTVATP
jgi:hypothetical protein